MTLEELFEEYMTYPAFNYTALSDVNQIGDFGDAPLHLASRRGAIEEMKILLENGADVNLKGEFECTPLHGAISMGKSNSVKLLLKHGADPNIKNLDGNTSLDIAKLSVQIEPSDEKDEILGLIEAATK